MSDNGKFQNIADNPIRSPIKFLSEEQQSKGVKPIYFQQDHPNDDRKFAILASTENGKYLKGGLLTFNLNGITIMTEPTNVIFVDLNNKTAFIREFNKVNKVIAPDNAEEKQYILLIKTEVDGEDIYCWEALSGRKAAYEYIRDAIEAGDPLDVENSFVLVDSVPYKDALNMIQFVNYIKNAELVEEDGFVIEEYL